MRFLFVDRILGYEPRTWIRAGHTIPGVDGLLAGPCLVVEALAQAAGWLIAASTGFTRRGLPLSIRSIQLTSPVEAGETVLLEAEIVAWRDDSAHVRGRASVDGRALAELQGGLCGLVPAERLEDPEQTKARFSLLVKKGEEESPGVVVAAASSKPLTADGGWPAWTGFNRIEGLEEGRRARAVWNVGLADDYGGDHFPCLPIVPGTRQAQAMAELARLLIEADGNRSPALKRMTGVKFRRLVRPGDQLVLEAESRGPISEQAIITVESVIEGKRVASIGEIHFGLAPHPSLRAVSSVSGT